MKKKNSIPEFYIIATASEFEKAANDSPNDLVCLDFSQHYEKDEPPMTPETELIFIYDSSSVSTIKVAKMFYVDDQYRQIGEDLFDGTGSDELAEALYKAENLDVRPL